MRDGRHLSPAPRLAAQILASEVSVIHAPPGMDGVGVVAAAAGVTGRAPVVLISADPSEDLGDLLDDELAGLRSHGHAVLVLTRTEAWSLRDQHTACDRARQAGQRRIVLATGTDRRFPVAPGVVLFSGRELRLVESEVTDYAGRRDMAIDAELAAALTCLSGGWPGLLEVAIDALHQWPVAPEAGMEVARLAVRQEVRRRLLPWLPREWTTTIAHLAVAGACGPAELRAARGEAHVPLGDLVRHGLAEPHPGGGGQMQLIAPLGEAIVEDMTRTSPTQLATLREQVADVRAALGVGDGGLALAHELRDWPRCAAIVDAHYPSLLANAPAPLLRAVVEEAPASLRRQHPQLRAHAEVLGPAPSGDEDRDEDRGEARVGTRAASRHGGPGAIGRRELLEAAVSIATHRRRGDTTGTARMISRTEAALRAQGPVESADALVLFHLSAGFSRLLGGDGPGAVRSLQSGWAEREHAAPGHPHVLAFYLALRHALRGEHVEATRWGTLAAREQQPVAGSTLDVRPLGAVLDLIRTVDGVSPRPSAPAPPALGPSDQRWIFPAWAEAMAALTEHRAAEALAIGETAHQVPPTELDLLLSALIRVDAHVALGRGDVAADELDRLGSHDTRTAVPRARLKLLTGDVAGAVAESAGAASAQGMGMRTRVEVGLIHAAAVLASGDTLAAGRAGARALDLAVRHGHSRALLTLPGGAADRLANVVDGLGPALEAVYRRSVGPIFPDTIALFQLTDRELAVLRGLASTPSQEALAATLHVSRNTVKSQVRSLYAKLGAHSRDEALTEARRHRLLD